MHLFLSLLMEKQWIDYETISSKFVPRALTTYNEKKVMQCYFKRRIILDDLPCIRQYLNTCKKYTFSPSSKPVSAE